MNIAIAHPNPATVDRLRELLLTQPGTKILWTARTADTVLSACRSRPPDLLMMGLDLPGLSAGELTRRVMAESPCCILLLNQGCDPCFSQIFEALGQGAADATILPPPPDWSKPGSCNDLLKRLDILRTLTGHAFRRRDRTRRHGEALGLCGPARLPPVLALGASTGGPKALATVLSRLPSCFPAAVVIVQHLDFHFTEGLADWLNQCTPMPVAALTQEAPLEPGKVWVAARNEHLMVNDEHILCWSTDWPELISRPSIDVFFNSLAQHPLLRGCGVLLTGMGRDGAAGLLALRQAGFYTIAQDQASCVVYGMPKAAAELDAAEAVLPLKDIAERIVQQITRLQAPATVF
jgi:two-component system response regulator WspF